MRELIIGMKEGDDLNALVAERVMGCPVEWRDVPRYGYRYPHCPCGKHAMEEPNDDVVANYSRDIGAAWDIVRETKSWLFSRRMKFKRSLMEVVNKRVLTEDDKFLIAWEEILFILEPVDLCKAALLTTY